MLKNWIKIFIYHLKNNKLFSALNVLGLSIGIAGFIFAILYWNDEQSYNQWNSQKNTVFQSISEVSPNEFWANNIACYEPYLKTEFKELKGYCYLDCWYNSKVTKYKSKKEILNVTDAQKNFFDFFPFQFLYGSPQTALMDENSIALSKESADKLFGSENPIGKEVLCDNKKLVVRGVYTIPGKSSLAPMAVVSQINEELKKEVDQWGNFNFGLLLNIKNPNDKQKVIAKLERLLYENRVVRWAKEEGITPEEWIKKNGGESTKIHLESLSDARLHAVVDGFGEGKGNYQFLLIMLGLSILILILSIFNYINLATANAIKRAKEVGVRKIVGASKTNIVLQFLFETILITLFSVLLSLVIVELSLPFYNEFLGKKLIIYASQFYIQILAIFIIVVIVAGVFPAIYVANFESLKVLKGNFSRSKSGIWLRNGMLIFQFAIASFFIIGSYIVYQQVQYISTKELGFKGAQVLQIKYRKGDFDPNQKDATIKLYSKYQTLKNEISKINGVVQVSTGAFSFGTGNSSSSSFSYHTTTIQGQNMGVDFGMLEMLKIKLVKGRYFDPRIASDTINTMMVNETALKMMNEKDPLGKTVSWNDKKLKIIGVVKDFHLWGPKAKIPPMVFFHLKTIGWMNMNVNEIFVKVDPNKMENTISSLEKFWFKNIDQDYPFSYDFVDKAYARTYKEFVNQKNLFSLLNCIVILIALFGLFALASYSIQRRMKEIAIRKTLGAETNVLLKELSKQYIVFCIIGFLIALFPVYYLLNEWLNNFAFRINISIVPFIIGFVALLSLTLIVVLSRAYQATKVDVLKYLKYE
ncbi:ABC transporter permease [Flavobacterium sp. SUN046]|uniref:ABC transporter permease n=1 Tax=Flavobacterium sp. SUN046 TaxID=3002440 RepID=UPI002DBC94B4|nr:ABC transporter permease [Flavobacterium sp. SUN046]MEC4048550.1 ABC transporter permease [Flavobacterium sp. SUN046]